MLASVEHAAISAYHKDNIDGSRCGAPAQKRKKFSLPTDDRVVEIASTMTLEKEKVVEKISIQENISKKLGQLKAESMAWQLLLSPQGYPYYYNSITGGNQIVCTVCT